MSLWLVQPVYAQQITPDNSLNTTVASPNGRDFTIRDGTSAGPNLFYSFREFSIPTGGSATFDLGNTPSVATIFSRVTGGIPSSIDGLIQSSRPVNLFLLNPSGILFGANAQLNIGGSFIGTTANGIQFSDGVEFSAVNLTATPLLTVSVPIGLQMGQNPGAILVNGVGHTLLLPNSFAPIVRTGNPMAGLQVKPNQTLALVGGEIRLDGGVLAAPQGRLDLISGANGTVSLTPLAQGWRLNADHLQTFRDITLTNRSAVEASGAGNTAIQLVGQTIRVSQGSIAFINTQGFQPPGNIQVKASTALEVSGLDRSGSFGSFIASDVLAGTGANMIITTPQVTLSDTAAINVRSFGKSQAGNITINASNVKINGEFDRSITFRTGITARTQGQSNAGEIFISTDQLHILNGGIITNSNFGSGNGSDVTVTANTMQIDGTNLFTQNLSQLSAATLNSGNAGNLKVNTTELSVTDGGNISTSTLSSGNAGSLNIQASRSIIVSGQNRFQVMSAIASGANIIPPSLQQALGLPPAPSGASGDVVITTPQLSVTDGATIKVNNDGSGNAGILQVNADAIYLRNSTITAATAAGEGGDLQLQTQTLVLRDRSAITATAGGSGSGGSIAIISPTIVGLNNSDIVANAVKGQGGNINITTQGIFGLKFRSQLTADNDITASSEFGLNGTVQITNPAVDLNSGLLELPTDVIDPTRKIASGCAGSQGSSFVVTGRGGMPTNPQTVSDSSTWSDLRNLASFKTALPVAVPKQLTAMPPAAPLVEATGWHRTANGHLELFATTPTMTLPSSTVTCAKAPLPAI